MYFGDLIRKFSISVQSIKSMKLAPFVSKRYASTLDCTLLATPTDKPSAVVGTHYPKANISDKSGVQVTIVF